MELMKYSKIFALAMVLAFLTACSGQDVAEEEQLAEDVTAEEVHTSDADSQGADVADANEDADSAAALPAITTVYFDFDTSNVRSEFNDVLNGHAAYLIENPDAKLVLEGHCDERGTREYNLALGERRGNAVRNYLTLQGVDAAQITVESFGKEKPAVRGNTEEAYKVNRRVEFKY